MKKQIAISIVMLSLVTAATVSAQTMVQAEGSAAVNTGGGLGSGISHMVRNILGDTPDSQSSVQTAIVPMMAPAPQGALMMQMNTESAAPASDARAMSLMSAKAAVVPLSDEELYAYVSSLMDEDSNIQSIDTASTHVRVTYAVPSKMFGFVRVWLKVTVGAYASGGTEVTYPWYAFAASKITSDFKARVNDRVEPMITSESFSADQQKTLIDEIHITLAEEFGSSTRGDR